MPSERLHNLRPTWIAFGWFIAAAASALVLLALIALRVLPAWDTGPEVDVWTAFAFLIGFVVGGFFVGLRVRSAPILHGLGIGLFSLVVWILVNLIFVDPADPAAWYALPLSSAIALLLIQTVSAIVGARIGRRMGRVPAESV